jgi:hypothetical protein
VKMMNGVKMMAQVLSVSPSPCSFLMFPSSFQISLNRCSSTTPYLLARCLRWDRRL